MIYHAICLLTDRRAHWFLLLIHHHLDFARLTVKIRCLSISVHMHTAVAVLAVCCGLKSLNMHFPCHLLDQNPILQHLDHLDCVKVLYVDLSSIFNSHSIFLLDVLIFHRVTYLHLTNTWVTWNPTVQAVSLHLLTQVTHLLLFLSTVCTMPGLLKDILGCENVMVLVLWKRAWTS